LPFSSFGPATSTWSAYQFERSLNVTPPSLPARFPIPFGPPSDLSPPYAELPVSPVAVSFFLHPSPSSALLSFPTCCEAASQNLAPLITSAGKGKRRRPLVDALQAIRWQE